MMSRFNHESSPITPSSKSQGHFGNKKSRQELPAYYSTVPLFLLFVRKGYTAMEEEEGNRVKAGKNTAIDYEKLEKDIEEQRKIGLQVPHL